MADQDTARPALSDAQRLATQGLCQCRICKRTLSLVEALTWWTMRTLAYAVCWSCISTGRRIVTRRCPTGVEVFVEGDDAPLVVAPYGAPGPGPQVAGPTAQKKTLGD